MLIESIQTHPHTIIQRISNAVRQKDVIALRDLVIEYDACDFTASITEINKQFLNKLLVQTTRSLENDLAVELVNLGADPNQSISFEIDLPPPDERSLFMLDDYCVRRYPAIRYYTLPRKIECNFLQLLAFLNNFELLQKIGAQSFEWSFLNVSAPEYKNCCHGKQERRKYEHARMINMMWCSIMCNWLAKNNSVDLFLKLRAVNNDYASTVDLYLRALESRGGSRLWMDLQYRLDRYANFDLAVTAAKLCLAQSLQADIINILPKHDKSAQEVEKFLKSYFWNKQYLSGFCVSMLPVSIFAIAIAINNILNNNSPNENYAVIVLTSFVIAFAAFESAKVVVAASSSALTVGKLKCFGSPHLNAYRLFTNRALAEIVQPKNDVLQQQNCAPKMLNYFAAKFKSNKPEAMPATNANAVTLEMTTL